MTELIQGSELTQQILVGMVENPSMEEQFRALLDASFPVPPGAHFIDDFPVWGETRSSSVVKMGAFVSDKLVSTAGLHSTFLNTGYGKLPVGVVGAVATDPQWRGKGLASNIVGTLVDNAKEKHLPLLLLWGSEHSLYQKLGFELCGVQASVSLSDLNLSDYKGQLVSRGWVLPLIRLLQKRRYGFEIGTGDATRYFEHKNVQWFWTGSPDRPTAYLAYGRGIDLHGFVHEWGGERESLRELLAFFRELHPTARLLGHPTILKDHGWMSDKANCEILCMACVLDPQAVVEAFGIGHVVSFERTSEETWTCRWPGDVADGLSQADLARLLFGPHSGHLKEPLKTVLPLPLWVWGLDAA